ncbi:MULTISPECIES: hypothetical protein [Afifella]|uniref:hypothetical protein n=1 Tax=Afifella TaxID=643217 RepID=UPI000FE39BB9|nr:hypothetical protein [Afifella aestuarii]
MSAQDTAYEGWAALELMGHRRRVGYVREVEAFGGKLLRIDIPVEGAEDVTEFYGCTSLYALRPVSEEIARDYAKASGDPRPVRPVAYRIEERREVDDRGVDDDDIPFDGEGNV